MNNVFIKEVQSSWFCIPETKTNNRKAIFFAISDSYSFAAANVIMGLNQYSQSLMEACDVIIYSNDLSEKNKMLLRQLHSNTYFLNMVFPESWSDILTHKKTIKWGNYVLCKYFGFFLIQNYEKVLHLDADMLIRGDISDLFEITGELAWRKTLAWDADENFSSILPDGAHIHAGSGGLLYFTDKLKKYDINERTILDAYNTTKDLKRGGIDETVIDWIVFKKGIRLTEVDEAVYNTPARIAKQQTKILHFLDSMHVSMKPWKNLAAFLYYEDWAQNYQCWLNMGGEGPINYSAEDYYGLFAFDLREIINKQNKRISHLENNNNALINSEHCLIACVDKEIKDKNERLKDELTQLKNSTSWKITKPFRWLAAKFRKLKKKVKSCLKS